MYDPLALDRQRIELERLRRRTESAPRRPQPNGLATCEPTRHFSALRRRPAAC